MPQPSPTVDRSGLDRRRFLGGVWRVDRADAVRDPSDRGVPSEAGASAIRVLVQAAPARLDAVADAIAAIAGVRLLTRDPPGRLTVEVPVEAVAGALGALAAVAGVLTTSVLPAGGITARLAPEIAS